jgi:MSHA biogenesis protein MshK
MAQPLIMRKTVLNPCLVVCTSILLLAKIATAQSLPDPTRPPSSADGQGAGKSETGPAVPILQSILVSDSRHIAIINGQMLKIGDKVGDNRIIKITESEVVLRSGKDLQVLKLFPGVEKQKSLANTPGKAQVGRQ